MQDEVKTLNDIYALTSSIDRPAAMKYKKDGRWHDVSVPEFRDTVRWFSTGLHQLGVKAGDRVAILSENRPQWTMADFAALCLGAVSVPVYPTLLAWQIEYILNDAGAVSVICSDQEQLQKIAEIRSHVPTLHNVILIEGKPQPGVLMFQEVVDNGKRVEAKEGTKWFDESRKSRKPDDLATLVYTSGTTGNPKGAMLTHGNITSNVVTVRDIVPFQPGDTALSILPLSHILERMVDFLFLYKGGTIAYAENVNKVADNLGEVNPEYFAAVPRLFEKMRARIMDNVAAAPKIRQKIFHWALGIAQERLPYMVDRKPIPGLLGIKSKIAHKLVFQKIHQRLGGKVKFVVSGGAPLSAELAAFFIGAGVEILEGYGLTETSPVIAVNRPDKRRLGTVGPVIPGIEVKIAEDGEILTRGPHVMKGYWNNPEATAQAIDPDGWFHTGDIGEIDKDGFLKITDRKKDIIINAYGKNIAPQPIEALLKSSPYIGTPVLIGDRRKYLAALLVPNFEKLERDAQSLGVNFNTREELVGDTRVKALIQEEIDRFNQNLDRQEKIRRFALLSRDFTIDEDEITPSLKVKRKVIDKKYKTVIDGLYADENLVEGTDGFSVAAVAPGTAARAFVLERRGDLAILWFDLPGEKVNKFSTWVMQEFSGIVDELEAAKEIRKVIVASRKPSIFIAGADVSEFTLATNTEQAKEYTRYGQQTFHRFSKLSQVTVAAINGAALGGGCELALSCDWRVMSDSPKAQIGLPEVKLGIFPAWGGTTKLPRLIGMPAALDIILNGKTVDGKRAKRMGLADEVVEPGILMDVAMKLAERGKRRGGTRTKFLVEGNPLTRGIIFNKARKAVLAQTHGHYPAPLKAIDVMEYAMSAGVEKGLAREVDDVAPLIMGDVAQNLVRLFFLMEEAKKDPIAAKPREVQFVGVLGAGIMGGGIAQIVADKTDAEVRMRDINWQAIGGGMKAASKIWRKKVERRRMTRGDMQRKLARIMGTTDWSGFHRADVVIEAVVENVAVKRQVLAEFEAIAKETAIFATNTSTIPITQIAAEAKRPENVVGMHFFNPVDRMPLVEVIRGEKTSDAAMVTVANLARKLGKTVVYCNDGPGFVVNRILGPYMNEAGFLLEEGNSIESLDKAMTDFGMPMGPMALLDEVGIDVAAKVAGILTEAFGARMEKSTVVEKLYADGRYGKKNGKGLYLYEDGKRKGPDPAVYKLLGIRSPKPADAKQVVERMLLAMINEAALILEEKIVASAPELDLAMIMGTGFPPFRGGLLRYADALGTPYILARLDELSSKVSPRYRPTAPLQRLAQKDGKFYQAYARNAS